ncbi:MAG: hypothetical protein MUD00_03560 [Candidatus Pacebacteria bacterium]|jgi:hypothetical protein|nr:hypothetical protein [Candidatus Paceibacterota bacterium]
MFKNFLMKKMLKAKGVPEAQIDMFVTLMEKNPELFKKIAAEIKQKTKEGKSEMAASMEVMRLYQGELQKLLRQ